MEWNYTKIELPITYLTGMWDGKKSDEVLAEDSKGKKYIAILYTGVIDGNFFEDWYDNNDCSINESIVKWCKIPD